MKTVQKLNKRRQCLASYIAGYFFVLLCISGYSQSDSLVNYLKIAAENNPVVLQRYYEYEAALMKIPQAGGLPDPELNIGVYIKPMELVEGKQVADIRLMQMFPWFGTLKVARDEMNLEALAKFESFRDARLQVYFEVQRTWYELHKLNQNVIISEKNIEVLRMIENLANARFKAGSPENAGLSDVYRIKIEIGDLRNDVELLKNQRNSLVAQFNSYLDRPPDSPVSMPDTLLVDSIPATVNTVSDSMFAGNPLLGMIQYELQSLEARKQMVTRMGYPMIGIGVDYSIISKSNMSVSEMNGKDMIMPMLTVTLPIYRGKYKAMRDEARLLEDAGNENLKASVNSLQTEFYQAIQLFQDARRRMKLYAEQYELASGALNIMIKSYANSGADLTDILRVRQQTLDYEYKQMEAIADFNISVAWLKRILAS